MQTEAQGEKQGSGESPEGGFSHTEGSAISTRPLGLVATNSAFHLN
jgi:hypothetical protein